MAINPLSAIYKKPIIKNNYINWATKKRSVVKNGIVHSYTYYDKMQKIVPKAFIVWIALMQCYFLQRSKKMPKERRVSLMFNEAYSCGVGLTLGSIFHKPISKTIANIAERAKHLYKDNPDKFILKDGVKTGLPFLSEAILCMYIGPVIATPLATQTTKFLVKKGIVKLPQNKDK